MTSTVHPVHPGRAVLACALHAASRGWPVFPLIGRGKTPMIRAAHEPGHPCRGECGRPGHGFLDATTDPDVIAGWWRRWPGANYGIATGPAGLVVIDLDIPKPGTGPPGGRVLPDQDESEATPAGIRDGADVLTWAADRDHTMVGWGETLTIETPSGGTHLFYTAPAGITIRSSVGVTSGRISGLGWCVDVRAVGGYVVGPGSHGPHGTGDAYTAIVKGDVGPVPAYLHGRLAAIGVGGDRTPCTTANETAGPGSVAGTPARVRAGYADKAVAGELAAIAAARPGDTGGGGRNATVNRAAFKLGRLIDPCHLDEHAVTTQLLHAALTVGLPEREARTAIASGLAAGRAQPRTLTTSSPHTHTSSGSRPMTKGRS